MTTTQPPPSRARRRPSSARREILDATGALLLEQGVEGVSIRRVSSRCGYSAPTIYHHFGDKTGLIDQVLEERFQVVLKRISAIPRGPDPVAFLRAMAGAFIRFALENPGHYRLLTVPRPDSDQAVPSAEATRALVKQALEEIATRGSLAAPDTETAFQVTWAMLHGLISLHLMRPENENIDELIETGLDVIDVGLLGREPRAR